MNVEDLLDMLENDNELPNGFKEWDICNKNNMTLKEIRKQWNPNED